MQLLNTRNKLRFCLCLMMLSGLLACQAPSDQVNNNQVSKKEPVSASPLDVVEGVDQPPGPEEDQEAVPSAEPEVDPEQTSLAAEYPLLEHLEEQKKLLLLHSEKAGKEVEPDRKYLNGNFSSGRTTLVLDEIDSEPAHFYGRIPGAETETALEFMVYRYSNEELDKMVPGKEYQVDWVETIAYMEPFDHGYRHCFVAYEIVEVE